MKAMSSWITGSMLWLAVLLLLDGQHAESLPTVDFEDARFIDGTEFNARNANLTHTEGANREGNTSKRVSILYCDFFIEATNCRPYAPYPPVAPLTKLRSGALRNCFFSPVQCLLPFNNKSMRRLDEKRTAFNE
uniref:Secreted protein n=1 Tax=Ascaris lumbricoides TaxID=6252 RepID=A0A0M3I043_ASCLU